MGFWAGCGVDERSGDQETRRAGEGAFHRFTVAQVVSGAMRAAGRRVHPIVCPDKKSRWFSLKKPCNKG